MKIKDKIISSGLKHKELLKKVPFVRRIAKRSYRQMIDIDDIELSPGISLGSGWHGLDNDREEPFRWTSGCASILLDEDAPAPDYITIRAASSQFKGKRSLTVGDVTMELTPDWRYYVFPFSKGGRPKEKEVKIVSFPPLSIEGDGRELGLMVKGVISTKNNKLASAEYEFKFTRVEQLFSDKDLKVVWLVSYPRSGNTWLRFLLTNLLFKRVEESVEVPLHIPDIVALDEIEKALNFGGGIFEGPGGQRCIIVKSHIPYSEGMILGRLTAGAIYIIRNPLDVVVSTAKHEAFGSGPAGFKRVFNEDVTAEEFNEDVIESMITYGESKFTALAGFGSWQGHVLSWLEVARPRNLFPITEIKYEMLKEDTHSQMTAIVKMLGLSVSRKRIEEAIELSSLSNMKKMQEREVKERIPGAFYAAKKVEGFSKGMRSINEGAVGTGEKELTLDQRERALMLFSNVMRKHGYMD